MTDINPCQPRITAIPSAHPYVAAVTGPDAGVTVLDDHADPGHWWPHPLLENGGGAIAAAQSDVVHVHFGFEHRTAAQLAAFAGEVHAGGAKLVVTVHDLDCPHVTDQAAYRRSLGALVTRADAVVTLTDSAADECDRLFGVRPHVIAHPPIVAADRARDLMARRPRRPDVSLSYKNLRRNTVTDSALPRAIAEALGAGSRLRIHIFPGTPLEAALRELADDMGGDRVVLDVSGPKDDDELHGDLAECTVAVLPYAFGTHSGWLEMCRDLGLRVVAPTVGHYAGQSDRPGAVTTADTRDPGAVAAAVGAALAGGPLERGTGARAAAAHGELYREVLG